MLKLFQYIKSIRTDNSGISALSKSGDLIVDAIEKANMLNEQFHSVFTSESDDPIPYKGTSKQLQNKKICTRENISIIRKLK
jgi:hypothetical protein